MTLVGASEKSSGSHRLGRGRGAERRRPLGAELVVVVCCAVAVYCTAASCYKKQIYRCLGNTKYYIRDFL